MGSFGHMTYLKGGVVNKKESVEVAFKYGPVQYYSQWVVLDLPFGTAKISINECDNIY